MKDQDLDLGRFAEPSLYILVSLSDGPKHGYAIMTDVEAISGMSMARVMPRATSMMSRVESIVMSGMTW